MSVVRLGELPIASGALALGDGFTGLSSTSPPEGVIPVGSYPVDVALARYLDEGSFEAGDERIAAARVRFSNEPVARWVVSEVGAGVDSGTCGFADGDIGEVWPPASESEDDDVLAELDAARLGPSANAKRYERDGHVVFVFSSGVGDGLYDGYWGLDARGNPAAFCLDFDLLVRDVTEDVELSLPLARGAVDHPALRAAGITARVPWFGRRQLVVCSEGGRTPMLRWRSGDRYLHPTLESRDRKVMLSLAPEHQPPGGVLVVRIVKAQEPMRPAL